MGDERAETYLRLRAEAELRRAGAELRRLDAAAGDAWAGPGVSPFSTSEMAGWKVVRAGRVLVAAGVLDQDYLDHLASDLHATIKVRSRFLLNWDRRRGMLHRTIFQPPAGRPSPGASQAMQVAPIGRVLRVSGDRVSWTLHLMSLVRTPAQAVITVAMRMHWPLPDRDDPVGREPGGERYVRERASLMEGLAQGPAKVPLGVRGGSSSRKEAGSVRGATPASTMRQLTRSY